MSPAWGQITCWWHGACLTVCSGCSLLAGWQRPLWCILLMLSSLRGSWFSTIKTFGTCSTSVSLWTRTLTCGCPAEVKPRRAPAPYLSPPRDSTQGFYLPIPVLRDMKRGRDLEQILTQYTTFVKPAFEEFCLPVRSLSLISFVGSFCGGRGAEEWGCLGISCCRCSSRGFWYLYPQIPHSPLCLMSLAISSWLLRN